jgi:hypothetical protein
LNTFIPVCYADLAPKTLRTRRRTVHTQAESVYRALSLLDRDAVDCADHAQQGYGMDITPEHRAELEQIGRICLPHDGPEVMICLGRNNYVRLRQGDRDWYCQHRDLPLGDGWGASPLAAYASYLRSRIWHARREVEACETELARIGAETGS